MIALTVMTAGVCLSSSTTFGQDTNTNTPVTMSNTAQNKGDERSDAITPISQSNATEDLKVTQDIRKAIEEQSNLSINAKNIKIITTTNHTVYLRGVVDTDKERRIVVSLARPFVGKRVFKNQLRIPGETEISSNK